MRVLHVISTVDPRGGGPISLILQISAADTRIMSGVQREIVCCDPPDADFLKHLEIPVHAVGHPLPNNIIGRFLRRRGYSKHLTPWLRAHGHEYDAIIVDGLWNYASNSASRILPKLATRYYVFAHGMLDSWFAKTATLKHTAKQLLWPFFEGALASNAEAVIFCSHQEKNSSVGAFIGKKFRSFVLGSGTYPPVASDIPSSNWREQFSVFGKHPYLLFLGRLHPIKGCIELIEAFSSVVSSGTDLRLVFVGPDESSHLKELQDLTAKLGISHSVHFIGPLFGPKKWAAIRDCDAFIAPSHYESFGISVIEAISMGKAVILSDRIPTAGHIVRHQAGISAPVTAEGLQAAILAWSSLSVEQRKQMGLAAKRLFEENYHIDVVCQRFAQLIQGRFDEAQITAHEAALFG